MGAVAGAGEKNLETDRLSNTAFVKLCFFGISLVVIFRIGQSHMGWVDEERGPLALPDRVGARHGRHTRPHLQGAGQSRTSKLVPEPVKKPRLRAVAVWLRGTYCSGKVVKFSPFLQFSHKLKEKKGTLKKTRNYWLKFSKLHFLSKFVLQKCC